MTTKLDKSIKREVEVDGKPHTVTLTPEGIKLTEKGCRNGTDLTWKQLKDAGIQN
jgi:hypothetical protein